MRFAKLRRWSMAVLSAGTLMQFGGCVDPLFPGAVAVAEQVILAILFSRLAPL